MGFRIDSGISNERSELHQIERTEERGKDTGETSAFIRKSRDEEIGSTVGGTRGKGRDYLPMEN